MVAALLIAASFVPASSSPSSTPVAQLEEAVRSFNNFDDAKAAEQLRMVLAYLPSPDVAAKAHLYLGLIAFNAHELERAQKEFQLAVRLNSSIELREGSPKARIALEEARAAVLKELGEQRRLFTEDVRPVETPRTHLLALTLGGVALVTAAVAVAGAFEMVSYTSTMNQVANGTLTETADVGIAQQSNAQAWEVATIVCAIVAAAGVTGTVLTW